MKGDAIAGIAIVLVNVVGGLAAGALRGMDLAEAARRYALLAIGDGLVSQIPALLVAVSAGVAVTRVAAEDETTSLGSEIGRQLVAEPASLATVAALLGGLALAPGLPAAPFALLAAAAAAGALHLRRRRRDAGGAAPAASPRAAPAEAEEAFAPPAPIVLAVAEDLFALARGEDGRLLRDALGRLREELWRDLGVRLPAIALRPLAASAGAWTLLVDDAPVARGWAVPDEALSLAAPDDLALAGIAARAERDPLTGRAASVVAAEDARRAGALGPIRGPLDRMLAEVAAALSRSAHHLVGVQEAQVLLDALEPAAPALVREAGRQIAPALLAEVLRRLVEEDVSIRPLRTILEAMLEAGGGQRGAAALSEASRRALRRHIAHRCGRGAAVAALLLDPAVEHAVRGALVGETLALGPEDAAALLDRLDAEVSGLDDPPVILTSGDVRRALRSLVAPRFPRVPVIAYEELPPDTPVRPVGRLAIAA